MMWKTAGMALAFGGAGGTFFYYADLPLPWMLGSMSTVIIAALSGLRPVIPMQLRSVMLGVLGLMLGSAFTPDLLQRAGGWGLSLTMLFAAMAGTTALVSWYLRRAGRFSPVTAYFSAAPGGINEMVLTGAALGGDDKTIAMIHFLRILMIVFTIPIAFRMIMGLHGAAMTSAMGDMAHLAWTDAAVLAACGIGGAVSARLARVPAPVLIGPMAAAAIIHIAGLTRAHPPAELVIAAQIVTGTGLGCRIVGLAWRDLAGLARIALGSTAIMVAIAGAGAGLLSATADIPFSLALLAFVPGGIAEMCLIALAMGQDVAFVSTHHVLRVMLVIVCAPPAFRLAAWFKREKDGR